METRITRKRSAQIKHEQETRPDDFIITSLSSKHEHNEPMATDCQENIGQSNDQVRFNGTRSGVSGQPQILDENNNVTETNSSAEVKTTIVHEDVKDATLSPTKLMKLEDPTIDVPVGNTYDNNIEAEEKCNEEFADIEGEEKCNEEFADIEGEEKCLAKDRQDDDEDDCDKEATAEEIVEKLCKNGKVLTLTEGEKYFKVIVYEDSEENKEETDNPDQHNTCQQNLLQKIVDGDFDDEESQSTHSESQPVLTDRTNSLNNVPLGITQALAASQVISAMPQAVAESAQWYNDVCSLPCYSHTSPAAAIQSNFTQTMNQFAPAFLVNNHQEQQEANLPFNHNENTPQFMKPQGPQSTASQRLFCTPHPKHGQYMFYFADDDGNQTRANFIPFSTSTPLGRPRQKSFNKSKSMVAPNSITLNSSGEENQSPPDRLPNNIPATAEKKSRLTQPRTRLDDDVEILGEDGTLREQHNQKERRRRARIKEACDLMRQLVPGMSDKTDKATVFEFGARYIHFLKSFIGTEHDKHIDSSSGQKLSPIPLHCAGSSTENFCTTSDLFLTDLLSGLSDEIQSILTCDKNIVDCDSIDSACLQLRGIG